MRNLTYDYPWAVHPLASRCPLRGGGWVDASRCPSEEGVGLTLRGAPSSEGVNNNGSLDGTSDCHLTVISCLTKWAIWDKVKLSKYRGIGCHTDVINNLI